MKAENILEKVMHFVIHSGFMFTVGVMGLVHAGLLIIMLIAGVTPLVQFNILSVVVYGFCVLLCRAGHIMPVYVSIIVEVTAYTIISTHYVGLRCGTYCFLFSIVPIIIYFGTYLFKGVKRWNVVIALALNFVIFAFLYIKYAPVEPVFAVSPGIRLFLVMYSSFAMVFATIFYNTMYIYSSEMQMSSLEQQNRQLSEDAQVDALTSLLNRRGFLPLIEPLMKDEQKGRFCIAFCDIDNFKRINDSYGHDAGDEVLRHITGLIRKEMSECEICRWGGEEIVILMRDLDISSAKDRVENLRKSIETSPTPFYNKRLSATITIGLEENRDRYSEPEEIIKAADERMYYGKQHGKNILICEG